MKNLVLSARRGTRPTAPRRNPHTQVDQTPSLEVYEKLVAGFLALPNTSTGASLVSVPGARAAFLSEDVIGNRDAFFKGREFAHVHPASDGSLHMILSEADCAEVLARGWGELHPSAGTGQLQRTAVMVYAPRDDEEIATVLAIARAALEFASTPTNNGARTMEQQHMIALVERHLRAEGSGDVDGATAVYTDDIVHDAVGFPGSPRTGKQAAREFYQRLIANFRTESEVPLHRWFADNTMLLEQTMTGTVIGEMLGIPGNGRRITFRVFHVFEFTDGLVSREQVWIDSGAIVGQLTAS